MLVVAVLMGCGRPAPAPKPQVTAKPVIAEPTAEPALPRPNATPGQAVAAKKGSTTPEQTVETPAGDDKPTLDEPAKVEAPLPPAERVAILTPGGPLLIDVRLTLDGQPFGAALAKLVKEVLDASDANGDGRSTWKELSENDKFLAKQMPGSTRSGYTLLTEWKDKHDVNRDGAIQFDEAASWLGRDAGRTARAFALRTSRAYSPDPRTTSRMWPLLDADADGRLSEAELQGAAQRLWLRDADDDRVIALSELVSLRDQLNAASGMPMGMRQSSGSASARLAALHLEPKADMERVDYVLQDMYAPLQDLKPASFAALPGLFDKLDDDGDEWLRRDELANLRSVPAHVELIVSFNSAARPGEASASFEVQRHDDVVATAPGVAPDRLLLTLGKTRLVLAAQDLAPRSPPDGRPERDPEAYAESATSLQQTQVRLVVHDESDAIFDELDANADGRLGEREIATAPERLGRYDANGDGQLTSEETPYEMIVAFVRGEQMGENSFTTPPSLAPAKGKATDEWFTFADLNRDGDVSRREFVGSARQFAALDADGDGFIAASEVSGAKTN